MSKVRRRTTDVSNKTNSASLDHVSDDGLSSKVPFVQGISSFSFRNMLVFFNTSRKNMSLRYFAAISGILHILCLFASVHVILHYNLELSYGDSETALSVPQQTVYRKFISPQELSTSVLVTNLPNYKFIKENASLFFAGGGR